CLALDLPMVYKKFNRASRGGEGSGPGRRRTTMTNGCLDFHRSRPSRRNVLRMGVLGGLGLGLNAGLPGLLRAAAGAPSPRAKSVIFLHQFGGASHHDTFDMKPAAPAEIRGEFRPIASSVPGLEVCEHLPRVARLMDRVCLVRSVNHT